MKINILFEFKDGPWGGGNQFLKALRDEFKKRGVYEENPKLADLILFNSHHSFEKILNLKLKYPEKKFIHRIDGPVFLIRNKDLAIDKLIFKLSKNIADFSIFQSEWSLEKCKELGFENNNFNVIYNAPDNSIFNTDNKSSFKNSEKIKIIATSWSGNPNKGFDTYKHLDENLDFKKYEFIFIGNSPIKFKNVKYIPPLSSDALAKELKKADIYITASKNDPCSNSLIEALSCGLPAVVFNDGGHPELIQKGGEIFNTKKESMEKIEAVSNNYNDYVNHIPQYKINDIADKYISTLNNVFIKTNAKKLSIFKYLYLFVQSYLIKLKSILKIK